MYRIITLLLCLAFAAISYAQAHVSVQGSDAYDFGRITTSDTVSHTFEIRNDGDAPLIIHSASTSCHCTQVTFTSTPIPPATLGTVSVTFTPDVSGTFSKKVSIKTNASNKRINLRIRGEAIRSKAK